MVAIKTYCKYYYSIQSVKSVDELRGLAPIYFKNVPQTAALNQDQNKMISILMLHKSNMTFVRY